MNNPINHQINNRKNGNSNYKAYFIRFLQENSILLVIYIFAFIILLSTWLQPFVEPSLLVRDIFILTSAPVYLGIFSNIGIFLWFTAGAISLFSGKILSSVKNDRNFSSFLMQFGLFTIMLAIDDFFMLHESFFPILLKIPEKLILLSYALTMLFLLIKFRKILLHNNLKLFIATMLLFCLSIIADQILPDKMYFLKPGDNFLVEDGFKFLAIISWSFYFIQLSLERLKIPLQNQD